MNTYLEKQSIVVDSRNESHSDYFGWVHHVYAYEPLTNRNRELGGLAHERGFELLVVHLVGNRLDDVEVDMEELCQHTHA